MTWFTRQKYMMTKQNIAPLLYNNNKNNNICTFTSRNSYIMLTLKFNNCHWQHLILFKQNNNIPIGVGMLPRWWSVSSVLYT
mmetsp:Transcript_12306/g.16154  ORF Transcript_12306/g.16154 Transcript_12306/m.16154 type:complete len:82 (-) Transcript_12306:3629-3874(-)